MCRDPTVVRIRTVVQSRIDPPMGRRQPQDVAVEKDVAAVGAEVERLLSKNSLAARREDPINRRVLPDTESYTGVVMLFLVPFSTMWVYALGGFPTYPLIQQHTVWDLSLFPHASILHLRSGFGVLRCISFYYGANTDSIFI